MKKYEEPAISMQMLVAEDCLMASATEDPNGDDKHWI